MADKTTRQECNREIINKLSEMVEKLPNLCFNQMLWVLDVITRDDMGDVKDNFYEESSVTLDKIKKAISELNK